MDSRSLTLKISSRAVRILYVVESREDVLRAIRFYTHIWGGAANAILPLPRDEEERELFRQAVTLHDPDFFLASTDEAARRAVEVLGPLPYSWAVLTDEQLTELIEGPNEFHIWGGTIPHITRLLQHLHPNGLTDSNIRVVEPDSGFDFELALHFGLPGNAYRTGLLKGLGGKLLRAPSGIEEFIKAVLIAGDRRNPASLTIDRTSVRYSENLLANKERIPLGVFRAGSEQSLFLDDGQDVHTPAAFWNARRVITGTMNKYLLPRQAFLSELRTCLALLRTDRPLAEIVVFTSASRDEATEIRTGIETALADEGVQLPVAVYYRGYGFAMKQGGAYWGPTETLSRSVNADGSVRFRPSAPDWLAQGSVFGYDATVELATGARLSLPQSHLTSALLLNDIERLRRAEANEQGSGALWLRNGPILRARRGGIAGFANPGKELRFHLHEEEFLIGRVLKERGFRVEANRHTRYARGFIRRFGGIQKTLRLVRAGGAHILGALDQHRAEQAGLCRQQIDAGVERQSPRDAQESRAIVEEYLPRLLAAGLVRRGVALHCPHCDLKDWYAVDTLREFMECTGCAEPFQLRGGGLRYSFVANELARRLIHEGGHAVLQAASVLRRIEGPGAMQFGGNLFRDGERRNFAEVDLLLLSGDAFAVAECKAWDSRGGDRLAAVEQSLRRTVNVAPELGATVVFLGVVTNEPPAELFTMVQSLAAEAESKKIAVHLILNDQLHVSGEENATDTIALGLSDLLLEAAPEAGEISVGSLASSLSFELPGRIPSIDMVTTWEQELHA